MQGISGVCVAQTIKRTTTTEQKTTYVEEILHPVTGQLQERRYWDSENDKRIGDQLKTDGGWVSAWGSAVGRIDDDIDSAWELKRMAQKAALDIMARNLAKEIRQVSKDVTVRGSRNGQKYKENASRDIFEVETIAKNLPAADKACSYYIINPNGTVTMFYGIGFNRKAYESHKKGYLTEEEGSEVTNRLLDM